VYNVNAKQYISYCMYRKCALEPTPQVRVKTKIWEISNIDASDILWRILYSGRRLTTVLSIYVQKTYCDEIILLSWNFPTVNCKKKKVIGFSPRGPLSNFNVSAIVDRTLIYKTLNNAQIVYTKLRVTFSAMRPVVPTKF